MGEIKLEPEKKLYASAERILDGTVVKTPPDGKCLAHAIVAAECVLVNHEDLARLCFCRSIFRWLNRSLVCLIASARALDHSISRSLAPLHHPSSAGSLCRLVDRLINPPLHSASAHA